MKTLAALAVLLPTVALAQGAYPPPPSYYPPPPPGARRYQPEPTRDTWYIGFGVGAGDGSVSGQGQRLNLSDLGGGGRLGLNFKVGATLTPKLLLGFDLLTLSSFGTQYDSGGFPYDATATIADADLMLTYFPWEKGFFVRGGVGPSFLTFDSRGPGYHDSVSYGGFNGDVGAGYAFWLGRRFNLTLNADFAAQTYGSSSTRPESSRFFLMWVGFDWY
ncbi:outer membrane beta-barrel protein [Anaeromyxobacter paludicola]|uniref:Outer membrane protein beta-barrel domain-containing protein n=1 Tax=Anaeromyxobacter paludicola TaxID=2918171 RepID=A0ABM7XEP9_9BACT|nr:outer membrane beta-barrel protein [Anaeromyxobacter paludicola]BDG10331.1 hypothetical protein AMPC_34440 [Anaeromyxobacter paludicola]